MIWWRKTTVVKQVGLHPRILRNGTRTFSICDAAEELFITQNCTSGVETK
jgi:hypothetical protein